MVFRFYKNSLGIGVLVILILSSCASGPKKQVQVPGAPGQEFAALAPGGLAYFYADVNRAQPILANMTLKNVDMGQTTKILEKVDFLSGAVYPSDAPRHMLLHAWKQKGNIPGGGALALSSKWKKTASPSGRTYYHSARFGLSASVQGVQAFVSDGDPFLDGPPITVPQSLNQLRWEALVLGWLENAGTLINNFLSTTGLPVNIPTERILFAIYQSAGQEPEDGDGDPDEPPPVADAGLISEPLYELRLRIETQNVNQARALSTLLAFVRIYAEGADISADQEFIEVLRPLLANPPSQDGADLIIHTRPMNAGGIALLFNRFAVYSQ